MKFRQLPVLCSLAALCLLCATAQAQSFPSRPLNMMVAWPAGGASDFVGRVLAKEMSSSLGQNIIVENSPGAGGTLGTNKAMKAPADGYTLMLSSPADMILSPLSFKSAQYRAEDARTVLIVGRADVMLVARKDLPVSDLAGLAALMKSSSGKSLSYCTPGNGSLYHLIGEKLSATAGVSTVHVPYSGLPQCVNDLVGGTTVDFAFLPMTRPFPGFIDSGNIKPIALLGNAPSRRFPQVPLASATQGFDDFTFSVWAGLHVNGKVPDAAAEVLNVHANAALAKPEVRAAFEQSGSVLSPPMTLKQAHDEYLKDVAVYTAIFRSVGLPRQ
jgi:tripartite-type tricarboxylate transporter receptor subunit TctC